MHQDFPKLFSEISADDTDRDKRWAGIEAFASEYTTSRAEVLVRLAFGTKSPAGGHRQEALETALDAFHKSFLDADPSYEQGARQDQILAVAALLQYSTQRSLPAIAVTTTSCGNARKTAFPIDVVSSAENTIARLGAARRKRPNLSNLKVEAHKFEFKPDFSTAQPSQPQSFKGVFDQFHVLVDEIINNLTDKFNASIEKLVEVNNMADEELDMLSWAFGGRALMPDKDFGDLPAAEKPLVLARDLASLTKIYPGPTVVPALLSRAGVKNTGKIRIVDAVNAVSDSWTSTVLKGRGPSPASSPIHFALARREETGAGEGWQAGWAATTRIGVPTALPPIQFAELFYREILWLSSS